MSDTPLSQVLAQGRVDRDAIHYLEDRGELVELRDA